MMSGNEKSPEGRPKYLMSVSEVVLLLYDRFANLETIPSQRDLSTINMTV